MALHAQKKPTNHVYSKKNLFNNTKKDNGLRVQEFFILRYHRELLFESCINRIRKLRMFSRQNYPFSCEDRNFCIYRGTHCKPFFCNDHIFVTYKKVLVFVSCKTSFHSLHTCWPHTLPCSKKYMCATNNW